MEQNKANALLRARQNSLQRRQQQQQQQLPKKQYVSQSIGQNHRSQPHSQPDPLPVRVKMKTIDLISPTTTPKDDGSNGGSSMSEETKDRIARNKEAAKRRRLDKQGKGKEVGTAGQQEANNMFPGML